MVRMLLFCSPSWPPSLAFKFCYPLCPFVDPSSKQTGLLVLSGTHSVFATLLFLLPLIPHSWTVISPSLLVTIPSTLQREEMLILTRVLSMSLALFTYYFTESLEPSFCEWYIRPILEGLEKLLTCLKSQTWKVAKLGFGIFFKDRLHTQYGAQWGAWTQILTQKSMAYTSHTRSCLLKFCLLHKSPLVTLL